MARYDRDILEELADHKARVKRPPTVDGVKGLVIEHAASGFVGTVTTIDTIGVRLRGDDGIQREFRLQTGAFRLKGQRVTLVKPAPGAAAAAKPAAPQQTASGSVAVKHEARVAKGSRLLVEGVHDAELVEKVWGDDLRHEGIVVERLDGLDHLDKFIDGFRPASGRRLGVLVDHLVAGSKEARIVARVAAETGVVTQMGTQTSAEPATSRGVISSRRPRAFSR